MSRRTIAGFDRCAEVLARILEQSWPLRRNVLPEELQLNAEEFQRAVYDLSDNGLITYEALDHRLGPPALLGAALTRRGSDAMKAATVEALPS
jgi:DNA-binding IclR family transcriptional regulator